MKGSQKLSRKKFNKKYLIYSLPIIILGFLAILFYYNLFLTAEIEKYKINNTPLKNFSVSPYPILKNDVLAVTAESAIIMDKDTKVILYNKNIHERLFPASTTKLMTALLSVSLYNLNDVLTIKNSNIEGSVVGFSVGEKVKFENLLYSMLLPSGNDAAYAIADNYSFGETSFIDKMNENAAKLNLFDTHFADPAGISDENNYMTAYDLASLASVVLDNQVLKQMVSTKYKTIENEGKTRQYTLINLNKLLGEYGVNGVKTGYTDKAGQVLVTSKDEKGHTIIIVVMKSQDRFSDTRRLLEIVSGNVTYLSTSQL